MTALATILRVCERHGVTKEQREAIAKDLTQELGGSPHYFSKRLHPGFVAEYMQRTAGMSVRQQVEMMKREFSVPRATAYRWVTRGK